MENACTHVATVLWFPKQNCVARLVVSCGTAAAGLLWELQLDASEALLPAGWDFAARICVTAGLSCCWKIRFLLRRGGGQCAAGLPGLTDWKGVISGKLGSSAVACCHTLRVGFLLLASKCTSICLAGRVFCCSVAQGYSLSLTGRYKHTVLCAGCHCDASCMWCTPCSGRLLCRLPTRQESCYTILVHIRPVDR